MEASWVEQGTDCGIAGLDHCLLNEVSKGRCHKPADKRKRVQLKHLRKADDVGPLAKSDDVCFLRGTP